MLNLFISVGSICVHPGDVQVCLEWKTPNKVSAHQRISLGMLQAISGLAGDAFVCSSPSATSGALKYLDEPNESTGQIIH